MPCFKHKYAAVVSFYCSTWVNFSVCQMHSYITGISAVRGGFCTNGGVTDLSMASGIQELVAAVTLETQLVPVLAQWWHLFSCTQKTRENEWKRSHHAKSDRISVLHCVGLTSPIASLSTIMISLYCMSILMCPTGNPVLVPIERLRVGEYWECLSTTQDTGMTSLQDRQWREFQSSWSSRGPRI